MMVGSGVKSTQKKKDYKVPTTQKQKFETGLT
jgi:hypothetical protein